MISHTVLLCLVNKTEFPSPCGEKVVCTMTRTENLWDVATNVRPLSGKRLFAQANGSAVLGTRVVSVPFRGKGCLHDNKGISPFAYWQWCPSPCGEKVICTPCPETLTQRDFLRQNASTSFSCSIIQGLLRIIFLEYGL